MKNLRRGNFTLIEVVVALAILTLSLAGLFQLFSGARMSLSNAEDQWYEMHMLTQGAEYLLLVGNPEDPSVPEEFFPYERYSIECEIEDAEGLPEEFDEQENQMPLKKWVIKLVRSRDGAEVQKVVIDRYDHEYEEEAASGD